MTALYLTKKQARRFLLLKHGLLGEHRFSGQEGILAFIRQAGCVQFDPIDVCGKNAEIALQSRVEGFRKEMLYELLYEKRLLLDYFDKNISIIPVENWPHFERERNRHKEQERSKDEIWSVRDRIIEAIRKHGPLCSADFDMPQKVDWYWSSAKLSRAALEHLYFCGELAIHHKSGTIKYYDLASNCIPAEILEQPDPNPCDHDHRKWCVLQRIGSVGLMWDRASDAWLGIAGLKAAERTAIFAELLEAGQILSVEAEGMDRALYCRAEDLELLQESRQEMKGKRRCEFLAPLDNMLWDRKLIAALFDFSYKWEIYTPMKERQYGYYVLPILCGEEFVGRIELAADKKAGILTVKNVWLEENTAPGEILTEMLTDCIKRFARFNNCTKISKAEKE